MKTRFLEVSYSQTKKRTNVSTQNLEPAQLNDKTSGDEDGPIAWRICSVYEGGEGFGA
eukprot:SAG31_NODE_67_length_28318_cov_6.493674_3_plen_58_part_00